IVSIIATLKTKNSQGGQHHRIGGSVSPEYAMEPYRIYIDSMVREIVELDCPISQLTTELKLMFLKIPALDVRMGSNKKPLMVAMSSTTSSLYDCIVGTRRKIKYPVYEAKSILQT